ncbi:MAG: transposase, partial [Chlamydiia bacterium]
MLLDIQQIFEIEQKCKTETAEERVRMRAREASPIIDALVKKVKAILTTRILPKSKLSGAIGYFIGLAPYLKNYIANPCARPDNNVAERALK